MDDLFSLKNKVAIITGGARGNVKAIAQGFLNYGAIVYTIDLISREPLSLGETILIGDITVEKTVEDFVTQIINECSKIDILLNNAGVSISAPSEEYALADWKKTFDTNLTANFRLSQLVAKNMIDRKTEGSIINITSLGSELGFPCNPAYVSAKGGLKMLTKALATDWAKYNIRVNNICPGYIYTNMTKKSSNDPEMHKERLKRMMIPRWGNSEDLVGAAIFLASNASRYVTGIDLFVDGGWTSKGL